MIENRVLVLEQGADWEADVLWEDETGAAIDITGYSASMNIKRFASNATPYISLTNSNGRLVLGGIAGTVQMKLSATDTSLLPTNDFDNPFVFDLLLVSGSGFKTKILKGKVVNRAGVT